MQHFWSVVEPGPPTPHMKTNMIRPATAEDAASISEVRVAAWQKAYRGLLPDAFLDALDPGAHQARLRTALASAQPPYVTTVATVLSGVAGFAMWGPPRHATSASTGELWALNVHPLHWRQGLGRALLAEALRDALAQGLSWLELWCLAGNRSAGLFYESHGFHLTGDARTTTALTKQPLHEVMYRAALVPPASDSVTGDKAAPQARA
jgi:GNAT superfamily N-acetyltransferase